MYCSTRHVILSYSSKQRERSRLKSLEFRLLYQDDDIVIIIIVYTDRRIHKHIVNQ